MDIRELSEKLAQQAEAVASYLLPQGKRERHEWVCGSVAGEPGQSLKVHLTGGKAGIWKDFQAGHGGDLIDLWKQVRGVSLPDTLQEIRGYLGIRETTFHPMPRKQYTRPEKPQNIPSDVVVKYLTKDRCLTVDTLKTFGVESDKRGYFLPSYRGSELVCWKKIGIDLDEKGKKIIHTSGKTEKILFGWQALDSDTRWVVITEGELDAMTLHQYGIPALSVPFGAKNHQWVDSEYPHLDRFDTIYLCFDSDEAGQAGAVELVQRLGSHRVKLIDLPGVKDPNEAHQKGVSRSYFDCALEDSRSIDPEELRSAGDYFPDAMHDMFYPKPGTPQGFALPWMEAHDRIRIRHNELSIWTGINGHGKSQVLGHLMLHLMNQGERVCIASMEIKPERMLYRLVRQASTMRQPSPQYLDAIGEWFSDKLWVFDVVGTAKWEHILTVFEYARKRYGITQFVIDSMMKCGIAEDDYRTQKQFVEVLTDFKNATGAHVHLVAHSRKGDDESKPPGKLDVKGTGAITDLADNTFSVWRNKKKEIALENGGDIMDLQGAPDGRLTCDKQRNGEWEGNLLLWFDRDSFQYLDSFANKPRRYVPFEAHTVELIGG